MPPINQPPSPDGFEFIKLIWVTLLLPIGELWRRHFGVAKKIAVLEAHAGHTKDSLTRIVIVLDRIEERMNQRRHGD